jgi:hypothetical protein
MRRIPCWLLTIAVSAAFFPRCLEAAQEKELPLAFSAPAYANPAFWIAHELKLFDKYGYTAEVIYISGSGSIQGDDGQVHAAPGDDPALRQFATIRWPAHEPGSGSFLEGLRFVLDLPAEKQPALKAQE